MKTIHHPFLLATGIAALLLPAFTARAVFFTSDTTIGVGNTNYDGQDIVVYDCTLTVDGSHTFSDVLVVNNGTLTHSFSSNGLLPNPINPAQPASTGLNLIISNNLVIESGSAIIADGKGYGGGLGNGAGGSLLNDFPYGPPFYYTSGGGGGYGGFGGSSSGDAAGGNAYGMVLNPTNSGSGGGAGSGSGGSGGGSIILVVGGDVLVDGEITANGANGANDGSGGGSGGGIWLSAQTIEGEGLISANGGAGEGFTGGGGGGGGRVAIYATTNDFVGAETALGGEGAVTGGAGTVYTMSANIGNTVYGQVVVDNGGEPGTNTAVDVSKPFDLTIRGGAMVPLAGGSLGNLVIASNSWLLGVVNNQVALNLKLGGNATIQPGGGISVDGEGNGSLSGGTVGTGNSGLINGISTGGGGGYGGYGGSGAGVVGKNGGTSYGSTTQPTSPGAGGGVGTSVSPYNLGGSGGGAILLTVAGTLQLGGTISANGEPGLSEASGGGSGGSIDVTAGSLSGNGVIEANGGSGQLPLGGGGGGGRIAIYPVTNQFTGGIFAYGGAGFVTGGAGTIYTLVTGSSGNGIAEVLVDNNRQQGTNTTLITVTGRYDLTITNGAVLDPVNGLSGMRNLYIAANSFLTVSQNLAMLQFTVTGNATIQPGGGIVVDGEGIPGGSTGQGSGGSGITNSAGGGHGGYGGTSAGGAAGGVTFDSITEPTQYGSSGGNTSGNSPFNFGGAGGGYVRLTVGGLLQLDGEISANGNPGVGQGSGGGSGGGILISCGELTGAGSISANGGSAESILGGGGGGGRIAISYATNKFTGNISAHGGPGFAAGGAGTIYLSSNLNGTGQIVLDNGGLQATNTPVSSLQSSDLILTNGATAAITPDSGLTLRNLVIGSNSFLSLTVPSQAALPFGMNLSGNATIQAGGGIILDGLGSAAQSGAQGQGSSYLSNGVTMGGGGSYGGVGGSSASGVPGGTYFGSIADPDNAGGAGGSGAGNAPFNLGGAGGGAMQLVVNGTLMVAGRISANGNPGIGQGSGGGAGGTIWLIVGQLSGNGSISANGGAGEPSLGGGGGGGGGRIALYPKTNLFTGTITAYGGPGFVAGGAGTIYTDTNNNSFAQVLLDNGGSRGAMTPLQQTGSFDLTVANGAIAAATTEIASIRNLLVTSNSSITLYSTPSQQAPLELIATGSATIQAGGTITADGQIGSEGLDPGFSSSINGVTTGGGGGYGGYGGGSAKGAAGGNSYGSIMEPESPGSNGGAGNGVIPNNRGGFGGGAIQLSVTGTLQLGGTISANGTAGVGQASGGGSGGSVLVTAGGLSGNGTISANGGAGEPSLGGGGGGGGGRIALSLLTNQFSGNISCHGGTGGVNGGAGTIYMTAGYPSQLKGSQLIVDNGGLRGTNTPLLDISGVISNLTITNGAVVVPNQNLSFLNLVIASNSLLTASALSGGTLVLSLSGSATIQAGGGLVVDGAMAFSGAPTGQGAGNTFSTNGSSTGTGGGYGGNGGASAGGGPGGVTYGSVTDPTQAGSSGGRGNGSLVGGPGGGLIELNITGALQLNGIISANGLGGLGEGSGGGSGGGILISVSGAFSGNGTVSANGGAGESVLGGGGGGGRIAISSGSNNFTGSLTAYGGQGFATGGAGTIYTKANNAQFGQLVFDDGGSPGATTFTVLPAFNTTVDLTITGGAKVNAANSGRLLTVHNLVLNSNSVLSLAGTDGSAVPMINVLLNATVQPGAQIVADGGGFFGNQGIGAGIFGTSIQGYVMGTGGGYGGFGGSSALNGVGGISYGSILQPVSMGSGGGCYPPPAVFQSAGGGLVQMTVGGTLDLEGSISANGATPFTEGCGGGSGGSIQLMVFSLKGAGAISANGGAGFLPYSGGGGGGRIAIIYTSNLFNGAISAHGGQGYVGGGAGTIYTRSIQGTGSVIVDNGGLRGTKTPISAQQVFNLTVSGSAIAQTPSITSSFTDPTLYLSSLVVQSNGVITTASANDNASLIVSGNAVIATNGAISADGKGYNGLNSDGPGAGMMLTNETGSGSGGGYGGTGGASASGEPGGITYGSSEEPTDWGSQGGVPFTNFVNFSQGGGGIRMDVTGTLTVNGAVTANGEAAGFPNSGGGAGGSIWLNAGTLNGNGTITANGGAGEPFAGGGGGGRIALYYLTDNFTGVTTASGAAGGSPGQNGTIFAANLSAPQFISQLPSGPVTNAVSSVTLTSSSQLGNFSLPSTDVTITTPNGVLPQSSLNVSSGNVYPQDVTQITISFPQQTAVGSYNVQINPPIEDIFGLFMPAAYNGSFDITQPIISGTVTDTNDVPVPGVTLQPSGGLAATISDANGNYLISVPLDWTGTLTPSMPGDMFMPSAVNFTNLTASVNQNFLAVPPSALALSSAPQGTQVNLGWFGANGVNYQVWCSTNLTDWQPYGNPIAGTNGMIHITAPIGNGPRMFFRFSAGN